MQVRESTSDDIAGILAMYPQAFPDEDLVPVVTELLEDSSISMSLVATSDSKIVGNVIFTRCDVNGRDDRSAMLAPLAVAGSTHPSITCMSHVPTSKAAAATLSSAGGQGASKIARAKDQTRNGTASVTSISNGSTAGRLP